MTLAMRIIVYSLIGIAAGILSWPFTELMIFIKPYFPNLLLYSISTGIVIGLFMGGCFGMSEGIISISRKKLIPGLLMGLCFGAIGGIIGLFSGQAILQFLGTLIFNSNIGFKTIAFPLSKALGWALFGICIGLSEGIRSRSLLKARNGIIGGFIGGIIGGLAFEYLRLLLSLHFVARLAGLILLGLFVGFFYGLIEINLSKASLNLLSGDLKGREYPLTQRLTTIGSSPVTAINLPGYNNIDDIHAEITQAKDGFYLTNSGPKNLTYVNDDPNKGTGKEKGKKLEDGDIIRIGNAQFEFKEKK
ncbi:MAG: FHA domain-containing protein [Spirochaetales bacterium]|nr:FHA domain-containing protein [Spirochaetales bacterium]